MWKNTIKKEEPPQDEDSRKFKVINPLLEKIKEYMKKHNLDSGAAKEAFEALEFDLMVDIGYTGKYEPDELTYLNLWKNCGKNWRDYYELEKWD